MRALRHLAVAAAVVSLVGLSAGTAHADPTPPPPPSNPGTPPTGTTPIPGSDTSDSSGSDDVTTGQVGNCHVVSSSSYLGLACGSGKGGTVNVKRILGDDPVPDCWDEKLSAAQLAAIGEENVEGADGHTWYWRTCLKPNTVSKDPNKFAPEFDLRIIKIDNGDPTKTLTENQAELIEMSGADSMIPSPVAVTSPAKRPRVGAWISFFDAGSVASTGSEANPSLISVQAGDVELRAWVESITVWPIGEGEGQPLDCDGLGMRARDGQTPENTPGDCWYRYERSSIDEPGQAYPVRVIAHWRVEANGVLFDTFDKSQTTTMPVTEIQAIVVN